MIITAVEPAQKRRGRVEVYVDGVVAFDIARTTATGRGLRPGAAIDAAQIDAIVVADRRRGALETAVAMLARREESTSVGIVRLSSVSRQAGRSPTVPRLRLGDGARDRGSLLARTKR